MLPGSRTRDVICKAAPRPYPKGNPRPVVPAVSPRDTRPTARFIEDNIVLCVHRLRRCHADCFPPSPAALRLPALWQSSRQLAGILPASRPRRRLVNYGVEKPAKKNPETLLKWQDFLALGFSTSLFVKPLKPQKPLILLPLVKNGDPTGNRTRATSVKGRCPNR